MAEKKHQLARWMGMSALALALAACGGGGSDSGSTGGAGNGGGTVQPPPVADARSGTYTLVAADGFEYTLAVDFDAKTYSIAGNGVARSGAIVAEGNEFRFAPGNAVGAAGFNTERFTVAPDAIIGEAALAGGTVPFVAARSFVNTVADVTGTYNFFSRTVDTAAAAAVGNAFQQAEITAAGELRSCDDGLVQISNCLHVTTGAITVSGDVFTARIPAGTVPFRIAKIGSEKVFLRASASTGTTRRFILGLQASGTFSAGDIRGGSTEPAWGTVSLGSTSFTSTGTGPAGGASTISGVVTRIENATQGNTGIVRANGFGELIAGRNSVIGVAVSTGAVPATVGYTAIGRAQ